MVQQRQDQLRQNALDFPTITALQEQVTTGKDVRGFHRDIVLAALIREGWIRLPDEAIERIGQTLETSSHPDSEALESWAEALTRWDELEV
jgi:hypothetical protein